MQLLHSYSRAFGDAFEARSCSLAHLYKIPANMNIDTSGCYKLFFCLSGDKKFRISDYTYPCREGDLFMISPQDWHYFSDFNEDDTHERYVFFIHPQYLGRQSTERTDLRACFTAAGSLGNHRLSLGVREQQVMLSWIRKLTEDGPFGADVLQRAYFLEMMVFVNQLYFAGSGSSPVERSLNAYPELVTNLIAYIHAHLADELSGDVLTGQFYLSYAHLNRIFKSATGSTLHKYISAQRIVLAKELLLSGHSVTDTCLACGFNDYSNFIKVFTAAVGCTPKKYAGMIR